MLTSTAQVGYEHFHAHARSCVAICHNWYQCLATLALSGTSGGISAHRCVEERTLRDRAVPAGSRSRRDLQRSCKAHCEKLLLVVSKPHSLTLHAQPHGPVWKGSAVCGLIFRKARPRAAAAGVWSRRQRSPQRKTAESSIVRSCALSRVSVLMFMCGMKAGRICTDTSCCCLALQRRLNTTNSGSRNCPVPVGAWSRCQRHRHGEPNQCLHWLLAGTLPGEKPYKCTLATVRIDSIDGCCV